MAWLKVNKDCGPVLLPALQEQVSHRDPVQQDRALKQGRFKGFGHQKNALKKVKSLLKVNSILHGLKLELKFRQV